MGKLFLPAIEAGTFVLGCLLIQANHRRPEAVADVLLLLAWMVGVFSFLAVLGWRW